jgi:hypothetical protein
MIRKLLFMMTVFVALTFIASGVMAQNLGNMFRIAGQTAGTIVNPGGTGDVLLFPYYDVRVFNGTSQNTLFAIINECMTNLKSDGNGIAAKLRFREWDKSEEVFDADIWLSKCDVWVGQLTRNSTTGLTNILSPDWVIAASTSFSSGVTGGTFTVQNLLASGQDFFTTFAPGGALNPHAPPTGFTAVDLTNMGYFELIGEERTVDKVSNVSTNATTGVSTGTVFRLGTAGPAYPDCPNVLAGYAYVVRVTDGQSHGYDATAIANFSVNLGSLFSGAGFEDPTLKACEDGLGQLEFEISKARVFQGYSIEDSIAGKFSMIVSFPTKHFHFAGRPSYSWNPCFSTLPNYPFNGGYDGSNACSFTSNTGEIVNISVYDRNENLFQAATGPFSPRVTTFLSLPWEVNIIGLYKTSVPSLPAIGLRDNFGVTTGGFDSGWVWIDLFGGSFLAAPFTNAIHRASASTYGATLLPAGAFGQLEISFSGFNGLPALALGFQEFSNFAAGGAYGVIFPAFYATEWLNPLDAT